MKLVTLSAIAALFVSVTVAHGDDWTGYTYSSVSTTSAVKGMNRIVDRVGKETDGELKIELHLGKTLQIASSDITQAVGDGVVDFAADFFFSGSVPIARVLNLPMLIENDDEWAKASSAMEPILQKAFAEQDVTLLGGYRYPEQTIFTTFEMKSLGDLNGHKIRVTSPEQGKFVEAFGGAPITLAGTDVPTALERGVIEGVLTASAGGAKNWHEFLPYDYRFPVNYGNSMIIANTDAFEALSDKDQDILRKIVSEEGPETTAEFIEDEKVQQQSQADAGMKITPLKDGDLAMAREKLTPFWETWAKENGPQYEEALKAVRAAIGK
ncbi:TRAP transporter substrate-binding protein DctP [Rhizobium halophytocola]|uniref:TRAP-type C4-dicarboxylate transport system substrate-binding protein n=1 Tax=Rhizobium halophytocola TaxID=735519 RepID=A0ABS4E4B4_9HYPH|nr:TRAP transporter substrate-binding protein DctP [Rhizobium halophytocola]MBP1852763.1 TRAP-type C4-dicarboxylate transport system substrate-binding protein [Rhizobium halophytocola]